MYLVFKKIIIKNANIEDANTLARWWNDGLVMAHAGFPNGIGQTPEEISKSIEKERDEKGRTLIIEYENSPIGEMSYRNKGNNIAEIGIKICDFSKQGKGIGTISLSMLIKYLFSKQGYEKIVLDTNLENKRAQYLYEKLGFRKLRTNHNAWKNQLGELQSSVDYELILKDFKDFTN